MWKISETLSTSGCAGVEVCRGKLLSFVVFMFFFLKNMLLYVVDFTRWV